VAGQIRGTGFKSLLSQVIGDPIVGPEMTRRVREMSDDAWYPYEDYVEVLRRLEDKLSTRGLAALAFNSAYGARADLLANGYTTPEKVFADYGKFVGMYAKDLDPMYVPVTLSVGPTHAALEIAEGIPRSFTEGYLRGFIAATGATLERLTVTPVERDQRPFLRFELRWS
jgi:hypothetical protein